MKQFFGLLTCLLVLGQTAWAQAAPVADSLRRQLALSAPDTNRVLLLLALGRHYILRPGERTSDLDTALTLVRQASRLSLALAYRRGQGLSYLAAGQATREKGNSQQGLAFTRRARTLLKAGTPEDRADTYLELASYCTIEGPDLAKKTQFYEQLIPLLQQSPAKRKLADALTYRGDLYQLQNKYLLAMRDLQQALVAYQSIGYTRLQSLYDLMGNVATEMHDLEQGLRYGLLGLKTAEQFGDSSLLVTSYNRVGITYSKLDMHKDAEAYFRQAVALAEHRRDTAAVLTVSANLVSTYRATHQEAKGLALLEKIVRTYPAIDPPRLIIIRGSFLRIYTRLHQSAAAQQACDKLLELARQLGPDDPAQPYVQQSVVPFYILTRQYARARQLLLLNQAYAARLGIQSVLADNHLLWFRLDSAQGDYPAAIRHYQQYHGIEATLLTTTRSRQIQELDVVYKTAEKQHNIQLLTQKNAFQQAQLAAARTTRNFSMASALLLVLLLALGYNRYRLKQRSTHSLEAKQVEINQKNDFLQHVLGEKDQLLAEKENLLTEKEWMLKEVHHRVKNNLQIITSLLNSQSAYLKDEAAQSAIRESQNRVHAMALIHQKLYQSEQLSVIPMADYIPEIVTYLVQAFNREDTVETHLTIEPVNLDITLTVPLGLILNEAITNSLKYGLPAGQRGRLDVTLRAVAPQTYQLLIHDDGVGLPPSFDPTRSRTMGLGLIRGLSKQIRGDLRITQHPGVQLSLTFTPARVPEVVAGA